MTGLGDSIWPEAYQTQQTYHAWLCWRRSKSPDAVFDDSRGTTHSRCDGADRQSGISMCRGAHVRYAGSSIMIMTPQADGKLMSLTGRPAHHLLPRLSHQVRSHTLPKNGWCRRHLLYRIFAATTS